VQNLNFARRDHASLVDIHIPIHHRVHTAAVIPQVEGFLLVVALSQAAFVENSGDITARLH
jgi:hypothetical protein